MGCIPPSRLHQFVKPDLLLLKTGHVALYRFGDCAHHPARFVIFAQLAKICIFSIIFFVFPILLIVRTCKTAKTVSDSIQYLLTGCFRLYSCRSCRFNICHIFLLLHNCCLHLEFAFLPLQSLYPHNPRSISLSLHWVNSAFPVFSLQKASSLMASCAMLPTLKPCLPPIHSCLELLEVIIIWIAPSICRIGPMEVDHGSFSEH